VAAELTNDASDAGELLVMFQAVEANLGELPGQALADAGYRSEPVNQLPTSPVEPRT
jgi:hypothetical protein